MKRIGKRLEELHTIYRSRPLEKTVHLLLLTLPWYFAKIYCSLVLILVTVD